MLAFRFGLQQQAAALPRNIATCIFGAYLAIHFAMLLPYGVELFSSRGVLPHAPFVTLFPDSPACVIALLIVGILASLVFADAGLRRRAAALQRVAAVIIWYILAALFCRNPLIGNPSLPFVGFMLLAHAFVDERERETAAWIVTAIAYSYSGWTKLASPSWIDGTAIAHVLANPLARPTALRVSLLALPPLILHLMTWGALALELLYAPLALSRRARPVIWTLMLLMHVGLLVTIDFADLSIAMIVVQMYTLPFDTLRPRNDGTSRHTPRLQLLRFQTEPRAVTRARRRAGAQVGVGAAGWWAEVPGAAQGAGEGAASGADRGAARS